MRIVLSLFFLVMVNYLLAQGSNSNSFAAPSVNNSFLGKSGAGGPDVSVDLYKGAAQVTIPICNLASKELQIPIALNYVDGRGIKMQEYASQVGLGWQLNAGGCITRVVRGFPDDVENGYLGTGTQPSGVLSAGQHWGQIVSTSNNNQGITVAQQIALIGFGGNSTQIYTPNADGEPDLFYVKTPFFSFQFVFNANGVPVFSNTNGYKIVPTNFVNSTNYSNSSFEVIDDQGNQFYFGSSSLSRETSLDSLYTVPYAFISTWYLDKIVTFNSKDNISLTYQATTGNDTTYNYSWSEATSGSNFITTLNSRKSVIYLPKFVSSIVSSLGEVDFNYVFNARQDDHNVPYLSSIVTKGYSPQSNFNSIPLQTYNFNYSYFGLPSSDPNVLRLQLTSISATGNNSPVLNIASFGYNITNNLPNRTWMAFDYWGYCNTTTNPPISQYNNLGSRNALPSSTFTQADILTSVTTVDGGTWNIYYEGNIASGNPIGGLRVNKIAHNTTGQNLFKTYQYVDINNIGSGQIYSSLYSMTNYTFTSGPTVILNLSGSPYVINDVNGDFIGYSWVKETDPNGGYTFYSFSNFNDAADADTIANSDYNIVHSQLNFSDIVSSVNLAYKRGLLLSRSVYNSGSALLTQITNTYLPLNHSTIDAIGMIPWNLSASVSGNSGSSQDYSVYWTPIENYRLTKTVTKVFDQITPANSITTTSSFYYDVLTDPLNNNRLIDSISTNDSKGLNHIQRLFFNEDVSKSGYAGIPMVTSPETSAINSMILGNKTNVVIHSLDNKNGTVNQIHNTYTSTPYALGTKIYLGTSTKYSSDPINTSNSLVSQKTFNYDAGTSELISYNDIGGAVNALNYGYNSTLPKAKVLNAYSTITYTNQNQSQTGTLQVPPNSFGPQYVSFTTFATGTITIAMPPGIYLSGSVTCYFSYSLAGPFNGSGYLCNSSVSGYTCNPPNTFSFSNCPAGTYTLTVTALTNTAVFNVPVTYTYTGYQVVPSISNEFYYEGFEENTGATAGYAHTGNMYYNANYTVPYTPPNGRRYLIQWWNFSSGNWNFNQQPYTPNMTVTGPVDDIRVFPTDALMTTYTHNPLIGKTSDTDPAGHTQTYYYDGLNRLQTVRDQDNNILKQYDYEYGFSNNTNLGATNTTSLSYVLTYNNTVTGLSYTFNLTVNGSYTIGNIPSGTYNVFMTPSVGNPNTPIIFTLNGSSQTYYSTVEFGSVVLNGVASINISFPPVESITVQNSIGTNCQITFVNLSTNYITNFTSSPTGTVVNIGSLPAGNYNVVISPSTYSSSSPNTYTIYSSTQVYYAAVEFGGVGINSLCPIVIHK